ncbi:MAG: RNA polymerase sigma factor [Bryobacterales bacterium]|nr:RNA polymerase sigma factor [Bryobacterales bacterium]
MSSQLQRLRTNAGRRTAEAFDQFHMPVFRYLASLTHRHAEAEDLLQETFLRFFRELANGNSVRDPKAWLFTVAHNLAMDHHRNVVESCGDAQLLTLEDGRVDVEAEMLAGERDRWLTDALLSLSPQQRQCLELRAEGLRYREIASVLGVQISTVRTFIVRAVTRLSGGPK